MLRGFHFILFWTQGLFSVLGGLAFFHFSSYVFPKTTLMKPLLWVSIMYFQSSGVWLCFSFFIMFPLLKLLICVYTVCQRMTDIRRTPHSNSTIAGIQSKKLLAVSTQKYMDCKKVCFITPAANTGSDQTAQMHKLIGTCSSVQSDPSLLLFAWHLEHYICHRVNINRVVPVILLVS